MSDRVLILENAYYSVISPEGCSVILFKNVTAAPQAAKALRITAPQTARTAHNWQVVGRAELARYADDSAPAVGKGTATELGGQFSGPA